MGIDAKLKRYFPLVICLMIAMAAYFQASGIGQLIATGVAGPPPTSGPDALKPGASLQPTNRNGSAILARNPFDSVTGPLDGSTPVPEATTTELETTASDEDPACDFGRVVLISASEDPDWSFAAIQTSGGESKLRRKGDDVSGHTVQALSWDRVWLASGQKRCQMKLGDKGAAAKAPPKAASGKRPPPRRGGSAQLPAEMKAKITKVSDTEYNIERSLVDEILENQATLMRTARITPAKEGDEVVGIRLNGIRSGSLLSELGLQNGDRLESINGFSMTDPQKALEAYGRLRSASDLKVQVNRNGSPVTLQFNIQ